MHASSTSACVLIYFTAQYSSTVSLFQGRSAKARSRSLHSLLCNVRSLLMKKVKVKVKSCLTLFNPMDCSLPGSSAHGIFQARIVERVAISFSKRSFQPRDWTQVSHTVGPRFTIWATREVQATNQVWTTNEDLMELESQRKDKERQEEDDVTEEPKRLTAQEMSRGFSLFGK